MKTFVNCLLFFTGIFLSFVSLAQDKRTQQEKGALQIGDAAPVFKLKSLDGKEEMDLASYQDKKPVVLFFGSYT